jgi:MoxR-like ATPase
MMAVDVKQIGEFTTKKGPVFANIVLADEINRAPAKVKAPSWRRCRKDR